MTETVTTVSNHDAIKAEIARLDQKIRDRQGLIEIMQEEINDLEIQIDELVDELENAES
jgi:TolA-binding protein